MKLKVIIFDFDGTFADTRDVLVDIINSLSGEFGYEPVDKIRLSQLRNLTAQEIIKQSIISWWKIPFLLKRIKSELGKNIDKLNPVAGMTTALLELKSQGYQLVIITSNNQENVTNFLHKNQLEEIFEFIYSETSLFGKHKVINKFLKKNGLSAEEAIYVGDETRDIDACKKSKVKIAAVSWGFNSSEILAKHQPDFLIKHPQELIRVVKNLAIPDEKVKGVAINQSNLSINSNC